MKIELVDNKRHTEIIVDGELWKEVNKKLYRSHLREIIKIESKNDLSDLILRVDTNLARGLIYKWLSLKGYMKSELLKKLKTYKIDPKASLKVLEECEKLGYLNDEKEAKLFIEREKRRGVGPKMVAMKLMQKDPLFKDLATSSYTDEEQRREIVRLIQKKIGSDGIDDLKVKGRLYRFLIGKGFDSFLIKEQLFIDS